MKVAVHQSNFIPWKGYFEVISLVDIFVIYDSVQYTKNDWRNRNLLKCSHGVQWLTIPTGSNINRKICDVLLPSGNWKEKHLKTISHLYSKAKYYEEVFTLIESIYTSESLTSLSEFNLAFISAICSFMGLNTTIISDNEITFNGERNERLLQICNHLNADVYLSGPAAKVYLDTDLFKNSGINVEWHSYGPYPRYKQLWDNFNENVSILDILFNCGSLASYYIKSQPLRND